MAKAKKKFVVTKELATKVKNVVSKGLVEGLGEAKPGKMCIEAAVCYAMGEPHNDNPSCVGQSVRNDKIVLNDQGQWSSKKARAKGMLKIAIAQLGSINIKQSQYHIEVQKALKNVFVPFVISKLPKEIKIKTLGPIKIHIKMDYVDSHQLYDIPDLAATVDLMDNLKSISMGSDFDTMLDVLKEALDDHGVKFNAKKLSDEVLTKAADCILIALKKCKSPGCKYLYLVK